MRISEDRYQKDLRRLNLAWRFIRLQARTPTIEAWTGLSAHRIRRLRNSYGPPSVHGPALKGVTPYRIEFFFQSPFRRCEAPVLLGFLREFDVLPCAGEELSPSALPSLSRGERFVAAFEQFRTIVPGTKVTFEHAVMFLAEIVSGQEVAVARCEECEALLVRDRLSPRRPVCPYCSREPLTLPAPVPTAANPNNREAKEFEQRSLF